MDVEVTERKSSHVLGFQTRINPMEADYGAIWSNGYMPHDDRVKAHAVDPNYYGVYYGTEQEGQVDFVAGMMVAPHTEPPEGLTMRGVPGGPYAKVSCTMGTIGQTWTDIYAGWLPGSDYAEDETRPGLEVYAPDMGEDPDAPVTIYIALKRK